MTTKEDIAAGSPAPQRSPYPQGKTHLFFIAIDDYRNGISKLYNAVSDAKAISDCLIENYQVNREDLVMLINEKATKKEICHQLDRYTEEITDEDNLIFLFSGHGYFHKNTKEGYWLTADSVKGEYTSFLNNGTITRYIRNIPARHIFGIVDACFSEALFQTQKSSDRLDHRYSIRSRWLLTAGRLEPVSDGAIGEQSPFAKSLLEELSHLESSHLWVSELCSRVTKGTIYNARHQTPRGEPLHDVDHLGGDFVFLRRGEELTAVV
ncbi:MAG: caspase family protein, partial [Bacteroidota bacterium]